MRMFLFFLMVTGCSLARAADIVPLRTIIPFTGELDFASGRIDLSADIRHAATGIGDVAAVLGARFDLKGKDPLSRELTGEITARYVLLNYKPVRDVELRFSVRDGYLNVEHLWLGALSARGTVLLTAPHEIDVVLELLSADLDGIWPLFAETGLNSFPLSGVVTGSLSFKGALARPTVNGRLQAYNGLIRALSYENIDLRFSGVCPLVRFEECRVVSSEGPGFTVEGAVDFSDVSRLGTQLKQLKRAFIVSEDSGDRSLTFKLNSSEGHSTQLKSFMSAQTDDRAQGAGIIGFEKHIGF